MKTPNLDKLPVAELKAVLKGYGMSQAGDKGTLVHRVKLKQKCIQLGLSGAGRHL